MRIVSRLAAAVLVAALLGLVTPAGSQDQAAAGDVGNGRRLYLADGCFSCHGRVGQGGQYYGPTPALAHSELPFDAFEQQLREPANNMPAYVDSVLSEQEAADIYAYLRTLPGRSDIKDLPAILTH